MLYHLRVSYLDAADPEGQSWSQIQLNSFAFFSDFARPLAARSAAPPTLARRARAILKRRSAMRLILLAAMLFTTSSRALSNLAQRIPCSPANIAACGQRLRSGRLVAFPTETVYGLGASIEHRDAIEGIFAAKKRPKSDPLIVHVTSVERAMALFDQDAVSGLPEAAILGLARAFWPGPLTIIFDAAEHVLDEVTASTGCVGVRVPQHPVARRLLEEAGVPIAAPSANRFGHVSPTDASHVLEDLRDADVHVLEGGDGRCEVGIESTVVKVVERGRVLEVLRAGAIGESAIRATMAREGLDVGVVSKKRMGREGDKREGERGWDAPGQLLKHYAPDVRSLQLAVGEGGGAEAVAAVEAALPPGVRLRDAAVLDIGGRLAFLEGSVTAYRDLSAAGRLADAARGLFDGLRWAERVEGAQVLLLPALEVGEGLGGEGEGAEEALRVALQDRLHRAVSGNVVPVAMPNA